MNKKQNNAMVINHETAMRLWAKSFGKTTKTVDFAGREIYKGAYNDRDSDYGWNIDHIYPESKGGKTADHNLICCHIKTNDEKSDSFPTFNANGHKFQIKKSQNHYEIQPLTDVFIQKQDKFKKLQFNYYDSAEGIQLITSLKEIYNKKDFFVGTITIGLNRINDSSIVDFINTLFDDKDIYYKSKRYIIIKDYNITRKDSIKELLDRCIIINTYIKHYFLPLSYIDSYYMLFDIKHYSEYIDIYNNDQDLNLISFNNKLAINELVKNNIENANSSSKMIHYSMFNPYYEFDYQYNKTYMQLAKNLDKEVSGK